MNKFKDFYFEHIEHWVYRIILAGFVIGAIVLMSRGLGG